LVVPVNTADTPFAKSNFAIIVVVLPQLLISNAVRHFQRYVVALNFILLQHPKGP